MCWEEGRGGREEGRREGGEEGEHIGYIRAFFSTKVWYNW